ncbi:MAG: hypothetical protein R2855_12305 [Thermomicrobiales bacterium]
MATRGYLGIGIAGASGSGGGFWPEEPAGSRLHRAWQARWPGVPAEAGESPGWRAQHAADSTADRAAAFRANNGHAGWRKPPLKYWLLGNSALGNVVGEAPRRSGAPWACTYRLALWPDSGRSSGHVAAGVTGGVSIHEVPLDPELPISTSPLMLARV